MRLRNKGKTIEDFGAKLQTFIDDLFETMYHVNGVGLAATQVGVAQAVAVIDISREKNQPLVLINPEIVESSEINMMEEGCLSVPNFYDAVPRAKFVTMRALNRDGKSYEISAEGLLAEAIQHEIDHLHGKLYIDYLSPLKQKRIRQKLEKIKQ